MFHWVIIIIIVLIFIELDEAADTTYLKSCLEKGEFSSAQLLLIVIYHVLIIF